MNRALKVLYGASKTDRVRPSELEHQFVYNTYDVISEHFDHTRFAKWPKVRQFLSSLEPASVVCDLGCGNGKYLAQKDCYMLGLDSSLKLLQIVKGKDAKMPVLAADSLKVPIRSQSCDAVLSIAVLHHLSTLQLRLQAIKELQRLLRRDGRGLVYVWCLEQQIKHKQQLPEQYYRRYRYLDKQQDVFVSWHLQNRFNPPSGQSQTGQSQAGNGIALVKRYYHLFRKGELQELIKGCAGLEIQRAEYDKENWCVQFRKTDG